MGIDPLAVALASSAMAAKGATVGVEPDSGSAALADVP